MEKHIHGGDVYHHQGCIDFSANCNPLGTPEGIKKAIIESLDHIGDYPQVGCAPLKEAIAEYEHTKPEQVICGNGAAEVIFSLCRAVNPKKALVPAPTFAEYQQALYSVDCEVEYFPLEKTKQFALDESFLQALTPDVDIIFLCNPNNPTGLLVEYSEGTSGKPSEPVPFQGFYQALRHGGSKTWLRALREPCPSGKNGKHEPAMECLFYSTGSRPGSFEGKRICGRRKTDHL